MARRGGGPSVSPAPARVRAQPVVCPRCGEELRGVVRLPLLALPGYLPAVAHKHKRRDGRTCTVYSGPAIGVAGMSASGADVLDCGTTERRGAH